jgi:GNAT superfamily N-acetyltransferase
MESARVATADDAEVLARLSAAALAELSANKGGVVWSRRDARPDRSIDAWQDSVVGERDHVVVGTIDDVVVGYAVARLEPLDDGGVLARLEELYVEDEARSVGVGDALLDAVLGWADSVGAIGLDALVLPGDRGAKNFFEAHAMVARAIVVHRPLGDR